MDLVRRHRTAVTRSSAKTGRRSVACCQARSLLFRGGLEGYRPRQLKAGLHLQRTGRKLPEEVFKAIEDSKLLKVNEQPGYS
jgi:hypothetical protein